MRGGYPSPLRPSYQGLFLQFLRILSFRSQVHWSFQPLCSHEDGDAGSPFLMVQKPPSLVGICLLHVSYSTWKIVHYLALGLVDGHVSIKKWLSL